MAPPQLHQSSHKRTAARMTRSADSSNPNNHRRDVERVNAFTRAFSSSCT
jgi:hypothetical protein